MTSDLIVVGASVRAAAQSALRAGFRPYAIDQFADRDLAAICPAVRIRRYPQDFLPALAGAPLVPWFYTGGLENHPRLVDRIAALRPLWGNPESVLKRVRDPWRLAAAVREAGLEMPTVAREIPEPIANGVWLQKPLRSSGGHKISLASSGKRRRGWYYQEHIRGESYGAVYLASHRGCALLGVSRQIRAPDSFAYQGSIVVQGSWHRKVELTTLGQILADGFGLRGLFNVDFLSTEVGIRPLEVNPRYSASVELLERATGVSLLRLHADVFCGESGDDATSPEIPLPQHALGKRVVYSPSRCVIASAIDDLVCRWNAGSPWPQIADVPNVGDVIEPGQPICTVFAEGATAEEVERQLHERSQHVLAIAVTRR